MPNDLALAEADAEPAEDGLDTFAELMQYEERQRSRPPPAQRPNSTKAIPDWSNPCGAAELARRIKAFWNAAGFDNVELTLFKTGHADNDGRGVTSIRSNLVAGLPPRQ